MAIPKLIQETRDRLELTNNDDSQIEQILLQTNNNNSSLSVEHVVMGEMSTTTTVNTDATAAEIKVEYSAPEENATAALQADAGTVEARLQLNDITLSSSLYTPNEICVTPQSQLKGLADPTDPQDAATKNYVDNIIASSDNIGTITAVKANGTSIATSGEADIPAASTSVYGVTKLSTSTSSTSTSLAATPSAVKSAYDLANAAMPKTGGAFTGAIQRNGTTTISSTTGYYRPIRVSTSAPTASDGNVGDIWIQYSV